MTSPAGLTEPSRQKYFRWVILLLMSLVVFGSYYVYDAIDALKEAMQLNLGFSAADYGLIYGMYSFPNTFLMMAVLGGIFLDKFGIRITGFFFALCCALGALLTAYGASDAFLNHGPGYDWLLSVLPDDVPGSTYHWTPQLVVMMLGRLLFGLGSETLIVVQNKVLTKWFKGKELGFAFGINLAVCRLGTALALVFSPIFKTHGESWTLALWVAAIIMLVSFFTFLLYMLCDKKKSPVVQQRESIHPNPVKFQWARLKNYLYFAYLLMFFAYEAIILVGSLKITGSLNLALFITAVAILIFFTVVFVVFSKRRKSTGNTLGTVGPENGSEKFRLSDIGDLLRNRSYVLICLLCVTFYSAVFPFQAFCPDILHNKFGLSEEWSGMSTSIIIWGTILFTPLFGWVVDRFGKRATFMIYGSMMLVAVHLSLALTHLTPFIAMFVLGVSLSLVPAAMWPAVALIVEEKRLGTAYGLMTSIQNIGLFAFPIVAGWITDSTNPGVTAEMLKNNLAVLDYRWTLLMFSGLGVLGIALAWLLKRSDMGSTKQRIELPVKSSE